MSFLLDDKINKAISLLKEFEQIAIDKNNNGYYVAISGGKDSSVIQQLILMSKVKAHFHHNLTSVDFPETIYFIRDEQKRIQNMGYNFSIDTQKYSDGTSKNMWKEIEKHGLPTKLFRHCCKSLKEYGGIDCLCIIGIRWAESSYRKKKQNISIIGKTKKTGKEIMLNNDNTETRRLMETCYLKNKITLNIIIDWTDDEIWSFIKKYNLPVNPLYRKGFKRIGCAGCPMGSSKNVLRDFAYNPKYKLAYLKAAKRFLERRKNNSNFNKWENEIIYFNEWLLLIDGKLKKEKYILWDY